MGLRLGTAGSRSKTKPDRVECPVLRRPAEVDVLRRTPSGITGAFRHHPEMIRLGYRDADKILSTRSLTPRRSRSGWTRCSTPACRSRRPPRGGAFRWRRPAPLPHPDHRLRPSQHDFELCDTDPTSNATAAVVPVAPRGAGSAGSRSSSPPLAPRSPASRTPPTPRARRWCWTTPRTSPARPSPINCRARQQPEARPETSSQPSRI